MQGVGVRERQVIHGNVPSKSNCYLIANNRLIKTKAVRKYEDDFYIQCDKYRGANIEGYFEFEIDVFYPSQRSDLDNSLKVALDCLQKVGAFKNDNKCTKIVARKFLDKSNPRIEFTINPI